jgi:tetratricopeptide (TPR) repeat protein
MNITTLRILCVAALAALLVVNARAQMPVPGLLGLLGLGRIAPPPPSDLQQAMAARDAGRNDEAAASYARVLADIDAGRQPPFLLGTLLPGYGSVLLALGRLDEAQTVLKRALDLEQTAPGNQVNGIDALRHLRTAFMVARETSKELNLNVVIDGDLGDPRGDFAHEQLPPTNQAEALLAQVYARRGDGAALRSLYEGPFQRVLARADEATLAESPLASNLDDEAAVLRFAVLLAATGNQAQAQDAFVRARQLNLTRLKRWAVTSPVLEVQLAGLRQRRLLTSAYLSAGLAMPTSAAMSRAMVEAIADSKGLANRYALTRRSLLASGQDSATQRARSQVEALERQLLELPSSGEAAMRAYADWSNQYVAALMPAMPALQRAGLDKVFSDGAQIVAKIQNRLGDAALLGYARYLPLNAQSLEFGAPRYVRYVVTRDSVTIQDIGSKLEIDSAVTRWRSHIDSPELPSAGRDLAARLLDGLPAEAASASNWFIDTDGLLSLLPFEALPLADGQPVLARRPVRYLTSMAQLAYAHAPALPHPGGRAVVLGDPTFDPGVSVASTAESFEMQSGTQQRLQEMRFTPLPDTREEARAVSASLASMNVTTDLRLGKAATFDALSFTEAPRFLHIATHGFFLAPAGAAGDPRRYRINVVVPGLLAGLVLAPQGGRSVLFASDMAGLDLRGTELVVLSACDTGNGLVDVGEGLTSMRRAAEEAGAEQLVSSLWPVPSQETARLMEDFYAGLARGVSAPEALRATKLRLRDSGAPARAWAGFVISGGG